MHDASIIIPTYNRARLLQKTLASIIDQDTTGVTVDVIIADDGSSDDTEAIARSFSSDLDITYLHQEDDGFRVARARNIGIRASNAEYCILLDCGMIAASGLVQGHLSQHTAARGDTAVIGYSYGFSGSNTGREAEMREVLDTRSVNEAILFFKHNGLTDFRETRYYERYGRDLASHIAPWVAFFTCNVSCRRDTLLRIGLFDENFVTWGSEDIELGYRLFCDGVQFRLADEAQAIHYPHPQRDDMNARTDLANKKYIHQKHRSPETKILIEVPCELSLPAILEERRRS